MHLRHVAIPCMLSGAVQILQMAWLHVLHRGSEGPSSGMRMPATQKSQWCHLWPATVCGSMCGIGPDSVYSSGSD